MSCCGPLQRKLWIFGVSTVVLILAIILLVLWPTLSVRIMHSQLVLEEGSMNYENWVKTPIPMYLEVTLFNWTNPDDIGEDDYKPNFVEVGPFVFKEVHERVNIQWNDNYTVTFDQIRTWHYDESLSNGSLSEPVTAANVITATVLKQMKDADRLMKVVVNYMLNHRNGSLTWTKPAGEWIFDGFEDPLLTFLRKFNSSAFDIPFKTFGWLVERNESSTYDGRFTMKTGKDDILNLGQMTLWKGTKRTHYYSDECGDVKGTTGELWYPEIDTTKDVTIFATDICRFVALAPTEKTSRYGVEGTKWKAYNRTFDNGDEYDDMKCFCPKDGECPKSGLVDISECRFGAPVYVSFPHFYMSDPEYVEAVTGLEPDEKKHEFTLSIEPNTGIPLDVNARLQINMLLQPISGIDIYKDVKKPVIMPMFWFRQTAQLSEEFASKAKLALALPDIGIYLGYSLGGLALLVIVVYFLVILTRFWRRKSDDQEPLSN